MPTEHETALAELFAKVAAGRVEKSINELFEIFNISNEPQLLERFSLLKQTLDAYKLVLIPDITKGDFETVRALRMSIQLEEFNANSALGEIQQGESEKLEFKSSLHYDIKKAEATPDLSAEQKISEEVLFSALKTLAAFLNSEGGVLYIGVADDGEVLGLSNDFTIAKTSDADKWQLFIRDKIRSNFKDGNQVNDWIQISIIEVIDKQIARIVVTPRDQLSFLKMPDKVLPADSKLRLFRRQGNRTANTEVFEIEEFCFLRQNSRNK